MSDTKFTPGPWVVSDELRTSINTAPTEDGTYKHIAMVNWCKYREYSIVGEEHDANAHLIAAAPEMYRALTSACAAVSDVTHCGGDDCTDCEVGTALRKARGE